MDGRPVIGLPTQTQEANNDGLPRCWIMSQRYVDTLVSVGAVPFMIPLLRDELTMRAIYEQLDGLFLCGGVDMDPSFYGQSKHPLCGRTDAERDATELQLVRWAIEEGKPVFGVCRGVQVINVALGGTLHQDLAAADIPARKHDYFPSQGRYARDLLTHSVSVDTESQLGRLLGARTLKVNSMHHQAIDELGRGLVVSAWADDGVIEAVESEDEENYVLAVQWHPEELAETDPRMRRLFAYFIRQARAFRREREPAGARHAA